MTSTTLYKLKDLSNKTGSNLWLYIDSNSIDYFKVPKSELLINQVKLELGDMQFREMMDRIYPGHPDLPKIFSQ